MLWQKFKHFVSRIKNWYRGQPEIVSVRPIGFKNPVTKISFDAVVLDSDLTERTLTSIGDSIGVTVKPSWKNELQPPFHIHLLQTNKRLVLIEEVKPRGGDRDG